MFSAGQYRSTEARYLKIFYSQIQISLNFFFINFYPFYTNSKREKNCKRTKRSRGRYPDLNGSTTLKKTFFLMFLLYLASIKP